MYQTGACFYTLHVHVYLIIRRAADILKKDFKHIALDAQEILATKERWDNVLALIPDENIL